MDTAPDLNRRLESLLRFGTIAEIDHDRALCRVQTGKLLTDWLPWLSPRAGQTRQWNPPTKGEQVMLLSPSGDPATGAVLPGLFSDTHKAPSKQPSLHVTAYPDGARISYDHALGVLAATGIQSALIEASGTITLDAPNTVIKGNLLVEKSLTYLGGMAGYGTATGAGGAVARIHGDIAIEGNLSATGTVMDGGGNSNHHSHHD
ncbi:phage baseplate assembly protein V [Chitinimonas arctica]|uniref:Phage baseplate assembly protein V n=2 Tax=Chitinimonas arctica TaxID=2594795 RepID=A0A516SLU5_9NEIS|nr:phage baseplate assembly protein V [Chitinimonas arctica]QDQ29136.1 phage baseplate assembly protein V [Chitinimonas arctica]